MYTTLFSTAILMAFASAIHVTQAPDEFVPTEASALAAELFAIADANEDGSVDKEELCAAVKAAR